jgi:ABC-type multidrug transport system ATPase subunit
LSAALAPAPATAALTLEASGLEHRYGARRGLDPLSFRLASPAAVAVTGPNGAGKSTLLRILAGLLRPTVGVGALRLDGAPVRAEALRRRVGFASPELQFYDELSVEENLGFAAEARGLADARAAVGGALERVGLAARARDRVPALSSGMKQRLRLAFALLERPALLLLDEPGSHLDDEGRAMVARVISEQSRAGLVILATNDEREWRLATQRIELRRRGLGDPS